MTSIERSIVIDRPIDEVWEFVHDTTKDALWQTTLVESEKLTDGPMGLGTRVRELRHFLASQSRSPASAPERQADHLGVEPLAARSQEVAEFAVAGILHPRIIPGLNTTA